MSEPDLVRRFVLERHPIRGHAVRMSAAWQSLREHQDYPPAVQQLLGEAVGAVLLLAATLKFDGSLTLQLQGKGLVNLLVAQCTHDFKVRAMARHDPIGGEAGFRILAGEGQIVVTVEATRPRVELPGSGANHRQFAGRIPRGLFRAVRAIAHASIAGRERGCGGRHAGAADSRRRRHTGAAR